MSSEDVEIKSADRLLHGRLFGPDPGQREPAGVLFLHGLNSSQANYAARAQSVSDALGATCLTPDLSGHGRDAANFSNYGPVDHLTDVIAGYDFLAMLPWVDATRLGASGASYGGYLAALLTAYRPVKRLVLRAPALAGDVDFTRGSQSSVAVSTPPDQDTFDSLDILSRYPGQTLLVESERDCVIPHAHISAYMHASTGARHEVIPEATHALSDPRWDATFVGLLVQWFREL